MHVCLCVCSYVRVLYKILYIYRTCSVQNQRNAALHVKRVCKMHKSSNSLYRMGSRKGAFMGFCENPLKSNPFNKPVAVVLVRALQDDHQFSKIIDVE